VSQLTVLFADDRGPDQCDREVDRWHVCFNHSIGLSECAHLTGKLFAGSSSQVDIPATSPSPLPIHHDLPTKKTSSVNPSGVGSQSLRISLPTRFWPLTGAHVALFNWSQMVRTRRCRVRTNDLRILMKKWCRGSGARCQIINHYLDNALHSNCMRQD